VQPKNSDRLYKGRKRMPTRVAKSGHKLVNTKRKPGCKRVRLVDDEKYLECNPFADDLAIEKQKYDSMW
jgi:hypothetical protein